MLGDIGMTPGPRSFCCRRVAIVDAPGFRTSLAVVLVPASAVTPRGDEIAVRFGNDDASVPDDKRDEAGRAEDARTTWVETDQRKVRHKVWREAVYESSVERYSACVLGALCAAFHLGRRSSQFGRGIG